MRLWRSTGFHSESSENHPLLSPCSKSPLYSSPSVSDFIIGWPHKRQGTGSLGTEKWITPCLRNNSHHLFGVDFSKVIPNCRTECFSVKNTQEARNKPPRGFTNSLSGKLASESIRKLRPASTLPATLSGFLSHWHVWVSLEAIMSSCESERGRGARIKKKKKKFRPSLNGPGNVNVKNYLILIIALLGVIQKLSISENPTLKCFLLINCQKLHSAHFLSLHLRATLESFLCKVKISNCEK